MEAALTLKILVILTGFYMAWNIGANDVSNAMGTSVGSGALTLKKAVIFAAILEFCGAYFVGANVSQTLQSGLIRTEIFALDPINLSIGMCAALLGTGIWLHVASFLGLPVSTTHAIVGAILGFGILTGGGGAIQWKEVGTIAMSWIVSPLLSGIVSFLIFTVVQQKILYALNPLDMTKKFFPFLSFLTLGTFTLSLVFGGLKHLHISFTAAQAVSISIIVGSLGAFIGFIMIKKISKISDYPFPPSKIVPQTVVSLEKAMKHLQRIQVNSTEETHEKVERLLEEMENLSHSMRKETSFSERSSEYRIVEKWFAYLQIVSACFVAFAHGANDVANAIGPIAAVLDTYKNGVFSGHAPIPSWLLIFGGIGIVIGLATYGWRVMETIGRKITELTPTRGYCAEFSAAIVILIASKFGLPISTTHCLVGAVLGVGLARGFRALNLNMLKDIGLSWIITIPASALVSGIFYYLLKFLFSL
ncbi:MAG: inorganic phosphate transporter [Chlamydiae bacterium]|nr:inorganic phosphate transporter [Chlamydiota bacterium]